MPLLDDPPPDPPEPLRDERENAPSVFDPEPTTGGGVATSRRAPPKLVVGGGFVDVPFRVGVPA